MHLIQRLLARNKNKSDRRFEVVNTVNETTLYLYDAIVGNETDTEWYGGVAADTFVKTVAAIKDDVIHLRINSPGGDVFAARAMENALRQHKAKVIVHVDGLAASAASYLALAGDEIEIADGAFFMIHKAWTYASGNADKLKQTVDLLDKVDASLADSYAAATGQSKEQIIDWMAAETWFSAEEAISLGFAHKKAEAAPKAQAWDLSAFSNAPEPKAEPEGNSPPAENLEPPIDPRDEMRAQLGMKLRGF
jgi:ATP-dependent Clp protease, protease subunit